MEYEDDISAEEETEGKGTWISFQNEHIWRKKSSGSKKSKRKKEIVSIRPHECGLFFALQKLKKLGKNPKL